MSTRSVPAGKSLSLASTKTEALKAALLAFALGSALVYLAGFAYSAPVHNAAHDTRHSLGFPCH
jgi:cobalt transporter subunit CbtB